LVKSVHVEGQIKKLALIIGYRCIGIPIKFHKSIYIIPYGPVIGMKDMGPVLMDIYTFHFLTINIAPKVSAPIDYQAFFSFLFGLMDKNGTKKSGAHNKVVVFHYA